MQKKPGEFLTYKRYCLEQKRKNGIIFTIAAVPEEFFDICPVILNAVITDIVSHHRGLMSTEKTCELY